MSTANVTRRRLSIGVPSLSQAAAVGRAPCSPITNEPPHAHAHVHTATKPPTSGGRVPVLKKIRSFTSMLARSTSPAPQSRPATPLGPSKKELKDQRRAEKKKAQEDYAAAYGSVFASEVALLQLLDGGSTSRNIERVHKAHAKAAARHGGAQHGGVASGAVRGPHGELFASAQEESERRGLVRGGYERSRSKRVHHADEDEQFYSADEDAPAWAAFQPQSQSQPRKRSNTAHAGRDARDAFFAESFAPAVPSRRA